MSQSTESRMMARVRALALEDLADTGDDDIRKEYQEAGQSIATVAHQARDELRGVVAASIRARVDAAASERVEQLRAITGDKP